MRLFNTELVEPQQISRNRNKTENQFTMNKDNKNKNAWVKMIKMSDCQPITDLVIV